MENPFLPIKPKDPIPIPFNKPPSQSQSQIPSKPVKPITILSSPKAPPKPPIDRRLSRLCRHGKLREAILAIEQGSVVQPKTYISLLQSCIDSDLIDEGRRLHSSIGSVKDLNSFVETKLVSMYAKCGSLEEARQVFGGMRERNLFTWSAMIGGCSREQRWAEVVDLFFEMMLEDVVPDSFLIPKILQACSNIGDVETGRLLHSLAVKLGFLDSSLEETHVCNSVLAMYAKCGELEMAKKFFEKVGSRDQVTWNSIISGHCQCGEDEEAVKLFDRMMVEGAGPSLVTWNILISSYTQSGNPELAMELMKKMESSGIALDVVTWTSLISGFAQNSKSSQALDLFQEMQLSEVKPNGMTVASAISACASLKALKRGMELHCFAIKIGVIGSVLVGNSLVDMYSKCGRLEDAERVFDEIVEKDVFSWNSMIGGYTRAGYCGKAYDLFTKMELFGIRRNVVTWNAMISGYIQNGDEDQAMEFFQRMESDGIRRSTASWNALISGSLHNGCPNKALRIFRQMQSNSEKPNSVTILSVLPACSNLVSSWKVKEIHASILRCGIQTDTSITNALIDTYSKSGDIGSARILFDRLLWRDHISWNSMFSGCILHGCSHFAHDLFAQMKDQGVRPSQAVFASMISAYSLDRMVNEGKELLDNMTEEQQWSPSLEHYTGMVELYGRAGRLREASELVEKMPVEPDWSVWDALLTAAKVNGNVKIATLCIENLMKLEPKNPQIQKLASFIQSLHGKSNGVSKAIKPKKFESRIGLPQSCCWTEVRNTVHTFSTGEQPQPLGADLESKLAELNGMKEATPSLSDIKISIEEQMEESGGPHCEKLAMAFALINLPSFRSIRIVKSTRMCTECHTAAKLVSKMYQREILLKDPKCFHHFRDGKCSCRDYW